jgi:hypothetical protein
MALSSLPRFAYNSLEKGDAMAKQRISYVDPATITDPAMLEELDRCRREGTPRPESSAIRAHVPACFWSFANSWRDIFKNGVCDHSIKELCRVYVSRSINCEYCGNQRSLKAARRASEERSTMTLNLRNQSLYERQKPRWPHAEAVPGIWLP